jgi:hypothetical protein
VYVIQSNEIKHLHHWNAGRNRTYWLTSGSVCTECHCCLQAVVTYHIFLFYFNRQIRKEDIQKAISNLSIIGITKHIYIEIIPGHYLLFIRKCATFTFTLLLQPYFHLEIHLNFFQLLSSEQASILMRVYVRLTVKLLLRFFRLLQVPNCRVSSNFSFQ